MRKLFAPFVISFLLMSTALAAEQDLLDQINAANPGDTVTVPAGTYKIGDVLLDGVTLKGAGYGKTIIDASGFNNGLIVRGDAAAAASDLTVLNSVQAGVLVQNAAEKVIERLVVRNCGSGLIANNAKNCIFQNLVIADNKGGVSLVRCNNSALMNVTLANTEGNALRVNRCDKTAIFNNLVVNAPYGITMGAENGKLTIDHNIYVANFVGQLQGATIRKKVASWHHLTGYDRYSQTIGVDFADPTNGDYRPVSPLSWAPVRATSSDWGIASLGGFTAPKNDIDGNRRVGRYDLGAYEVALRAPRPADGTFEVTIDTGITSAGLYTKDGFLVRYLFQNAPLLKGKYKYWLPTRNWQGRPIEAGDYVLKTTQSNLSLNYIAAAGNGDLELSKIFGGPEKRASLAPHAVAFAADGKIMVAQSGFENGIFLRAYDPQMSKFLWAFPGGGKTNGIGVDGKGRLLVLRQEAIMFRLDAASGKGVPFESGSLAKDLSELIKSVGGMAVAGDKVYVADTASNKIVVMQGDELNVTDSFEVPAPSSPAYDAKTDLIWVISGMNQLMAFDASGAVKAVATPVPEPAKLAANNGRLAVYSIEQNKITVFDAGDPAALKQIRTIGKGGDGYGKIEGDRFWNVKSMAMDSDGEIALVDGIRTVLLATDGSVKRHHMGIWGQQMSYGKFAGDDRTHFFNIGGTHDIIIDAKNRSWQPGTRWRYTMDLQNPYFVFNTAGKNFALFDGSIRGEGNYVAIVGMNPETGVGTVLARYGWDGNKLYLQKDTDNDGIIAPDDPKQPVIGPDGTQYNTKFFNRGFTNIDFYEDATIVQPDRAGIRYIPLKGLEDDGVPVWDFTKERFVRGTVGENNQYTSPYDFQTKERVSIAEDMALFDDSTFATSLSLKSGPGPDLCTEHANSTNMAGFDAQGNMRWLNPINPYGLKMGVYCISHLGDIIVSGRGAICEFETMDRDGLGTGAIGTPKEFHWHGMWLDNHRQAISFVGNDGKPYIIVGDYAAQSYHWLEPVGLDGVIHTSQPVSVSPAVADKLAAAGAQPVAEWPVPAPPTVTIKKLDAPLAIDGNPAKWRSLGIKPFVLSGSDPLSNSAVIRIAYHGEALYVQIIKFDDVLAFHQKDPRKHFQQDGIEFCINGFYEAWKYNVTKMADDKAIVLRDRFGASGLLSEQEAPRYVRIFDNAENFEESSLIAASTGLDMSKSKVVYIEFKLTKEALAGMPKNRTVVFESGKTFLFGFMVNDNDVPGSDVQIPIMWPVTYGTFARDEAFATGVFE